MKIPEKIAIMGTEWTIRFATLDCYGITQADDRTIVLNSLFIQDFNTSYATLKHELLHAVFHMSGIAFMERFEEEAIVRVVENCYLPLLEEVDKAIVVVPVKAKKQAKKKARN